MGNCDLSRMSDPHHEFKGKNVLIERHSPAEMASKLGMPVEQYLDILGECRRKLFEVRSSRPRPHLDDKVVFVKIMNIKNTPITFISLSFIYYAQFNRTGAW